MPVVRCPQCQVPLSEIEAAAAACPACGAVFARSAECEVAPLVAKKIPSRRPWGLMAAVAGIIPLVVVLWLARPAVTPPEETDAYRSLLAEKEKGEAATRSARLVLEHDLATARNVGQTLAFLEKNLAEHAADAAKKHADAAKQQAAAEEKLAEVLATVTSMKKALDDVRVKTAVMPGNLQDAAGIWRQKLEGAGSSFWELSANKDGTYAAHEVGLGNAAGTGRLKDGRLVIEWSNGSASGSFEWVLKGAAGVGKCTVQQMNGDVQVFESTVRFVGK